MTTGPGDSNPSEETPDTCDVCTLLQFIAEEVVKIKERLNLFEAQFGDFDSQNAWRIRMGLYSRIIIRSTTDRKRERAWRRGFIWSISVVSLIGLVHKDLKEKDNCLAMPEHWQFKVEGHRPQLVVQCAEMREDGTLGSAKYVVTIPHYQLTEENPPPPFRYMFKGKSYGGLKLNDNSKVGKSIVTLRLKQGGFSTP